MPRIAPQSSVTVHIMTRPTVGYKTIDELDVEARFELCADDGGSGPFVPCAGTFSTDGAVWHKAVVEFSGDVANLQPAAPLRSTVNVLFVGAVAHAGTSTLINTLLTLLSFSKHPLMIAPVGCSAAPDTAGAAGAGAATVSSAARVAIYTPELDREDACAVDEDEDASKVRLLDIASGECVTTERLRAIVAGAYDEAGGGSAAAADRKCDAAVYVMPASLVEQTSSRSSQWAQQQAVDKFHALNRLCNNALVALTQLDQCDAGSHARLRQAAQRLLGVPQSRVFLAPVYVDESKRVASVEQPCLALLLSATRQAVMNQMRR